MKRWVSILSLIISIWVTCGATPQIPYMVIATVSCLDGETTGTIYPNIVVWNDGRWEQGTTKSLSKNMEFVPTPELGQPGLTKVVVTETIDSFSAKCKIIGTSQGSISTRVLYKTNKTFSFTHSGEVVKPKPLSKSLISEFTRSQPNVLSLVEKALKKDLLYIKQEVPLFQSPRILTPIKGDFNGDKIGDYVFALVENPGDPEKCVGTVIAYISQGTSFQRFLIEQVSKSDFWPLVRTAFDVNNDGANELFIEITDGDLSYPIVYTWKAGGLVETYRSEEPWN